MDELRNVRLEWLFVSIPIFNNNRNGNEKKNYNNIIPYNLKIYIYSINKKLTIKNRITLMHKYSIIIFIKNLNNLSCLSSYKIIFYQNK